MQFQRPRGSSKGHRTQLESQEINQKPDSGFGQLYVPATGHGQVRLALSARHQCCVLAHDELELLKLSLGIAVENLVAEVCTAGPKQACSRASRNGLRAQSPSMCTCWMAMCFHWTW